MSEEGQPFPPNPVTVPSLEDTVTPQLFEGKTIEKLEVDLNGDYPRMLTFRFSDGTGVRVFSHRQDVRYLPEGWLILDPVLVVSPVRKARDLSRD